VVIAVAALAAVILWAVTEWLWLVLHEGLLKRDEARRIAANIAKLGVVERWAGGHAASETDR
jgi:hypothetical protein